MKTFLHYWIGMLCMAALFGVVVALTWVVGQGIDRLTSNVVLGSALMLLAVSLLVAGMMTWVFSARGTWLVERLSRWLLDKHV